MRALRGFGRGVALYWRGVRAWGSDPSLMLLGLAPAILTAALFGFLGFSLWLNLGKVARWGASILGPDEGSTHELLAFIVAMALIAGFGLLVVYTFVSVTSVIGQPFFEVVAHEFDDRLGPVPEGPDWPWWRNALRGIGEGAMLAPLTAGVSIMAFSLGLIPAVGTVLSWSVSLLVGGWFVALEFTSIPFERRGLTLSSRWSILANSRPEAIGFGAMAFVGSAIPIVSLVLMPGALVGGTFLARGAIDKHVARQAAPKPMPAVGPSPA